MNANLLKQLSTSMKSHYLDVISNLNQLGAIIHDKWSDQVTHLDFLSYLISFGSDASGHYAGDQDSSEYAYSHDGQEICCNDSNLILHKVSFEVVEQDPEVFINFDGQVIAYINYEDYEIYLYPHFKVVYPILQDISQRMSENAGVHYALADICDTAGSCDWTSLDNISNVLVNLVKQYERVLGTFTLDLIKAIGQGPQSLLMLISNLYNKVSQTASDNQLNTLLSSTEIVLNKFAFGTIVSTIGAIITTSAMIVASLSKIVGAILAGIGLVTQFVGRIVVSATTAFDSTQYKVIAGADTAHCFAFVVDTNTITNATLASYMRSHGWATMNVFCPHQGLLYLMYLEEYDNLDNNNITYESHLSTDLDISQNIYSYKVDDSNKYVPGVLLKQIELGQKTALIGYQHGYTDSSGNYVLPYVWMNADGTAGTTVVQPRAQLRSKIPYPDNDIVQPVEFSLFDSLSQWYGGNLEEFLDVRLCSAIIIHLAYLLGPVLTGHMTYMNTSKKCFRVCRVSNSSLTAFSNSGLAKFITLWNNAWNCFVTSGNMVEFNNILKSDFGLTSVQRDSLISSIQEIYNGLARNNYTLTNNIAGDVIQFEGAGSTLTVSVIEHQNELISVNNAENIFKYSDMFVQIGSYYHYYDGNALDILASGYWPRRMAIGLPTLTFTGFIAGLIVDGLVVLAAATIAIAATVGWVKLRNKRAKLQAAAEAKWYEWQDNGMTDEQWKEYKKARTKYNLLAIATGGTTLSLGLYDDGSSTESIINTLLNGKDSGGEDESIVKIVHLIKGNN